MQGLFLVFTCIFLHPARLKVVFLVLKAGPAPSAPYPAGSYRVTPRWIVSLFESGGCHSTRARTSCAPNVIVVVENIGYIAGSFRIITAHVVIADVTSACCIR